MSRRQNRRRDRKRDHITDWMAKLEPVIPPSGSVCPDCAVAIDTVTSDLIHEPSCPLYAALERAVDGDRDYFRTHPHTRQRGRPPTMAEVLHLNFATGVALPEPPPGHRWEPAGAITVIALGDGVRARDFSEMCVVAVVDTEGEESA